MDGDGGTGGRVLGVVSPRISGGFVDYLGRVQGDGGIAGAVQALGAFLANPKVPGRVVAKSKKKDGIMRGLGSWRAYNGLLRRLGWRRLS